MENIITRKLSIEYEIPYSLLLVADPSMKSINEYLSRWYCYVAFDGGRVVGVCILINTRPFTLEIVNIAMDEKYQGRGIGKLLVNNAINVAKKI